MDTIKNVKVGDKFRAKDSHRFECDMSDGAETVADEVYTVWRKTADCVEMDGPEEWTFTINEEFWEHFERVEEKPVAGEFVSPCKGCQNELNLPGEGVCAGCKGGSNRVEWVRLCTNKATPSPAATPNNIKDSGERREFATGAQRDRAFGKGRFDLLPVTAIFALARQLEAGAVKYSSRNWEKGMPLSVFWDSAVRHLFKFLGGLRDEDHLAAALFNVAGLQWTLTAIKEGRLPADLNDLPAACLRAEDFPQG